MAEVQTEETVPASEDAPVSEEKNKRTVTGVVVSAKPNKTITVRIERRVKHPIYGKFIRRSTKLHAHDESNDAREGDTVSIVECRPISKTKAWTLSSIVERASGA